MLYAKIMLVAPSLLLDIAILQDVAVKVSPFLEPEEAHFYPAPHEEM